MSRKYQIPIEVIERRFRAKQNQSGEAIIADRIIVVDPRQSAKERMDTLVHEALHIIFPMLGEHKVILASRQISRVLWKQSYRRICQ
jgi:hypothetical protein